MIIVDFDYGCVDSGNFVSLFGVDDYVGVCCDIDFYVCVNDGRFGF